MIDMRVYLERRLTQYIPVPETGCWLWDGGWDPKGYGRATFGRALEVPAHRLFYKAHVGPIPEGMVICHKCDTPPCVNPAHLFLGTQKDNMDDMVRKGRSARGEIHSARAKAAWLSKKLRSAK